MVATDWDGDGDTTEGVKGEIDTLAEALYAEIQKYAKDTAGAGIVYDAQHLSVLLVDADGDGKPDKNDTGREHSPTMPGRRACSRPPSTISTARRIRARSCTTRSMSSSS